MEVCQKKTIIILIIVILCSCCCCYLTSSGGGIIYYLNTQSNKPDGTTTAAASGGGHSDNGNTTAAASGGGHSDNDGGGGGGNTTAAASGGGHSDDDGDGGGGHSDDDDGDTTAAAGGGDSGSSSTSSSSTIPSTSTPDSKLIHYGDNVTLSIYSNNGESYLASCGYDRLCKNNQGVYTYRAYGYLTDASYTGKWVIQPADVKNKDKPLHYRDIIQLTQSDRWLCTCELSNCCGGGYKVSIMQNGGSLIQTKWQIISTTNSENNKPVIIGDSIMLVNQEKQLYLTTCGMGSSDKKCGERGQYSAITACDYASATSSNSYWEIKLKFG
jgi:hypothetical protein